MCLKRAEKNVVSRRTAVNSVEGRPVTIGSATTNPGGI